MNHGKNKVDVSKKKPEKCDKLAFQFEIQANYNNSRATGYIE